MASFQIQALRRRFERVKDAARAEAMKALVDEANEIAAAMRRAAPVDSGALRDSIRVEVDQAKMRVYVKAGGQATMVKVRTGASSSKAPKIDYTAFVEFGTTDTRAQPFFWPTWRLSRRRAAGKVTRRISKALKTAANQQGLGGS